MDPRPFEVEPQKAGEGVVVRNVLGPAVSGGDGAIEGVMGVGEPARALVIEVGERPRLEHERRPFDRSKPTWVRVERQTLRRLGDTHAIVFTIHTWLVPLDRLSPEQAATLPEIVRDGGSMGETN